MLTLFEIFLLFLKKKTKVDTNNTVVEIQYETLKNECRQEHCMKNVQIEMSGL